MYMWVFICAGTASQLKLEVQLINVCTTTPRSPVVHKFGVEAARRGMCERARADESNQGLESNQDLHVGLDLTELLLSQTPVARRFVPEIVTVSTITDPPCVIPRHSHICLSHRPPHRHCWNVAHQGARLAAGTEAHTAPRVDEYLPWSLKTRNVRYFLPFIRERRVIFFINFFRNTRIYIAYQYFIAQPIAIN